MFRGVRASSLGAEARLGRARSPVRAGVRGTMNPGEEKETMRGLNGRLAGYLSQVRLLEEANRKLEEQIKEVLKERRAAGQRDWSCYEKTLSSLKAQMKEMTLDNARLMLQIDNSRLAADDFKVKFEAEIIVCQGVEQDIIRLRKMIDDTHMSSMQLESEVESLTEELAYLTKNHEQEVADVKSQIRDSSVDVQMDAAKGQDLSETIDKIRQQYEKATQKSREETEAWYRNKFESISAEVSRNTDALQQGQNELKDLRRLKQGLEIDLQTMYSMNRSLEESLNDTMGRVSQTINSHNMVMQQLEAELSDVHAQVARQGSEYQTLLNIKSKLEEEIATYHSLLDGTGLPYTSVPVPGLPENIDFKGRRARDDVNDKNVGPPEGVNVNDNGAFENAYTGASGLAGNDESVEFSLEQALCAGPRNLTPEPTLNDEIGEETEMITRKDLELNAANTARNKTYIQKEGGPEMEEDPVILEEMEIKVDYYNRMNSVEEPVNETNENETVSSAVDTSVESTGVKAANHVENTGVEIVDEAACPEAKTEVEKVEEAASPVENVGVEKAVCPVENVGVEKAVCPVENVGVEKAVCPVENMGVEKVDEAACPEAKTEVEKVEEEASTVDYTQAKVEEEFKPVVEDNPGEQEMKFNAAVENMTPAEEKGKGDEPENPEMEPLQKVKE